MVRQRLIKTVARVISRCLFFLFFLSIRITTVERRFRENKSAGYPCIFYEKNKIVSERDIKDSEQNKIVSKTNKKVSVMNKKSRAEYKILRERISWMPMQYALHIV